MSKFFVITHGFPPFGDTDCLVCIGMDDICELVNVRLTRNSSDNFDLVLSGQRVSQMTKTYADVDAVQKLLEEVTFSESILSAQDFCPNRNLLFFRLEREGFGISSTYWAAIAGPESETRGKIGILGVRKQGQPRNYYTIEA